MMPPGRTLILLHSLGLDADSWTPMVEAARTLMAGARLVCIDLPGHGGASERSFDMESAAAAVIDAARQLGIQAPLNLVGSGLGSLTALHIATEEHADVGSLVLAGWPPPAASGTAPSRAAQVTSALSAIGAEAWAQDYLAQLGTSPEARQGLSRSIVVASEGGLIQGIAAAEAWRPPTVPASRFPSSLIIRGANDVRTTERDARGFAELLGGRFANIPDAGHLAYVDQPKTFAARLSEFHGSLT